MYDVELVWNREFHWCVYQTEGTIEKAIQVAKAMENLGDGASVKKTRITKDGKIVWQYGKLVEVANG